MSTSADTGHGATVTDQGEAAEALGADGAFAATLAHFAPRAAQQEMARRVEHCLEQGGQLLIEAGTGTGKTFAYLVPALLSRRKVLIATGTRSLQDQLFHRDLPAVGRALGRPVRVALLKGRSNYLCHYRLGQTRAAPELLRLPAERAMLEELHRFAGESEDGDLDRIGSQMLDGTLRGRVTASADNCLGQDCPELGNCFLLQARRRAQRADIVVVNHHLFFADAALREQGFGELLPNADAVVFDEAHLLPAIATQFFGRSLGSAQLRQLLRDLDAALLEEAPGTDAAALDLAALEHLLGRLGASLNGTPARHAWTRVETPDLRLLLEELAVQLEALAIHLRALDSAGRGLESCARRAREAAAFMPDFLQRDGSAGENGAQQAADDGPGDPAAVRWLERRSRSFSLHLSPLDIAPGFAAQLGSGPHSAVFTSATLAAAGRFDHFTRRLGLEPVDSCVLPAPYDYARNALLYLPPEMPAPSDRDFDRALVAAALPVLAASGGRAFMLFTSHAALRRTAERLQRCDDFHWLVQGSAGHAELLDAFRTTPRAVLLGTASFWQGVDVPGEALSCVIIDKLPFAPPDDPLLAARIARARAAGEEPFRSIQLPEAIVTLKQGAGRLIRGPDDRGVLMIADPRLARGYGRQFIDSLPPMRRTRELAEVQAFFAAGPVLPGTDNESAP